MSLDHRPGYYLDKDGIWKRDRRKGNDQRRRKETRSEGKRRNMYRRKEDKLLLEREHKSMVEDALEDWEAGEEPDEQDD